MQHGSLINVDVYDDVNYHLLLFSHNITVDNYYRLIAVCRYACIQCTNSHVNSSIIFFQVTARCHNNYDTQFLEASSWNKTKAEIQHLRLVADEPILQVGLALLLFIYLCLIPIYN